MTLTKKDKDTFIQARQEVLAIRERILKVMHRLEIRAPEYKTIANANAFLAESFDALTDVCQELDILEEV